MTHRLTEGHVVRHYRGVKGGRDAALLDVAQDFALDLYDLAWFAEAGALDDQLVRQLWVLKAYRDVVVDGRGIKPLDPEEILAARDVADFDREDIGYLTRPVDMPKWIGEVRARYAFLRDLTPDEARWCACNARDRYAVEQRLTSLT